MKATASSSLRVPVVPVNVTDCALTPSISAVAPSATVIGGAVPIVNDDDCAVVSPATTNGADAELAPPIHSIGAAAKMKVLSAALVSAEPSSKPLSKKFTTLR